MKLCIDCRYHKTSTMVHACTHPELADPVTGGAVLCQEMRRTVLPGTRAYCLFEGTLWEAAVDQGEATN